MKSSWEVTKRLNQDTTIMVLSARCVHFTGTYIIVLGRSSNHHICLRFQIWLVTGYFRQHIRKRENSTEIDLLEDRALKINSWSEI